MAGFMVSVTTSAMPLRLALVSSIPRCRAGGAGFDLPSLTARYRAPSLRSSPAEIIAAECLPGAGGDKPPAVDPNTQPRNGDTVIHAFISYRAGPSLCLTERDLKAFVTT